MIVVKLPNTETANMLKELPGKRKYNPVQDKNGNWIITLVELNHPANSDQFELLNSFEKITWQK